MHSHGKAKPQLALPPGNSTALRGRPATRATLALITAPSTPPPQNPGPRTRRKTRKRMLSCPSVRRAEEVKVEVKGGENTTDEVRWTFRHGQMAVPRARRRTHRQATSDTHLWRRRPRGATARPTRLRSTLLLRGASLCPAYAPQVDFAKIPVHEAFQILSVSLRDMLTPLCCMDASPPCLTRATSAAAAAPALLFVR
eukprot:354296-Chlamydomonas_euryale.AAC.4